MSEPTSADVRAAVERLRGYGGTPSMTGRGLPQYRKDLTLLTERLARLEAMLALHQWSRHRNGERICPQCGRVPESGHGGGCELAALLPPVTEGR